MSDWSPRPGAEYGPHAACNGDGCPECYGTGTENEKVKTPEEERAAMRAWAKRFLGYGIPHPWQYLL